VTIRPIQADDTERLQLSHDRLSPESRYRRFMSAKPHLTAADARYLVDIDGCHHYALVATVAEPEGEAIIAVARFVRQPDDPRTAEFAIVVGDHWQRQGLGGELLGRLADAAVTRGVERFPGDDALRQRPDPPPRRASRRSGHPPIPVRQRVRGGVRVADASRSRRPRPCDDRSVGWKLTVRSGRASSARRSLT